MFAEANALRERAVKIALNDRKVFFCEEPIFLSSSAQFSQHAL